MSLLLLLAGAEAASKTVVLDALSLAGSAPTVTLSPGEVAMVMDQLTLAGSSPTATILVGAVGGDLERGIARGIMRGVGRGL